MSPMDQPEALLTMISRWARGQDLATGAPAPRRGRPGRGAAHAARQAHPEREQRIRQRLLPSK